MNLFTGVCCAITVSEHLALVGPLVTREGFRGNGYGARLLAATMEKLGDRNIGLDAVEGKETLYQKPSFGNFKISSFKIETYYVPVATVKEINLAPDVELFLEKMTRDTMPEILEYDASFMPIPRKRYMERWLQMAALTGTVVLAKRDQRIVGYGAVYKSHNCESVGPLYANDINIAQALLKSLAQNLSDGSILKFRIPDVEELREWRGFLRSIKGEHQGSNTRMYTKWDVELPLHVAYSIPNNDNAIM